MFLSGKGRSDAFRRLFIMKKSKRLFLSGFSLILSLTFLTSCSLSSKINVYYTTLASSSSTGGSIRTDKVTDTTTTSTTGSTQPITSDQSPTTEPTQPESIEISLLAVGDNLIHMPLVYSAQSLGYGYFYSEISDLISSADVAVINQETILVDESRGYSGYPNFGSPFGFAEAALEAGFDVFTCATNHSYDKKIDGITDTLNFWKEHPEGLAVGIHEDEESYYSIPTLEVNGITIAFLNYTYGLNGYTLPSAYWYSVSLLTESNKEFIQQQIEQAKEIADFVVVAPHWGEEYVNTPTTSEVKWAQFFADCGVDLVIGCHPHVVQPVMEVEGKDGNSTLVYYSLGNFLSNQEYAARNVGGMASVTIVKDEEGTRIASYELLGTTVVRHRVDGVNAYSVILLDDLTQEMLDNSWYSWDVTTVAGFRKIFETAIKSYPKT